MNPKPEDNESRVSVLIVEDTLSLLRLYGHILTQAGYPVYKAANGQEALQAIYAHKPDVILLDRVLPDMDGSEICSLIKQSAELSSIYVIMLSALRISEDDRVSGLESGADDYIVKPVGRRELLARIHVADRLKRTQQALLASEVMFRTLAENSPDIICRFDSDLRYIYINRTVEDVTGRAPSYFLGKSLDEIERDDTLVNTWRSALRQVFETKEARRIEFNLPSPHGVRVIDAHLVPERNPEGVICSILSVARDFTEHADAEQQIARLATVVEQAVEAVVITDPSGAITYANTAFDAITGMESEEYINVGLQDLGNVYTDDFREHFSSLILSQQQWSGAATCRRQDGALYEVEASVFPIRDRSDAILNYALIQRDVTERQRTEREREALLNVAAALRKAETRADMLPLVVDKTMSVLPFTGALFVSPDQDSDESIVELARGDCEHVVGHRVSASESGAYGLVESGNYYVNNDVHDDDQHIMIQLLGYPTAVAAVPLRARDHPVGVLWVGSDHPIDDPALGILLAIADMAAIAIHRADLFEEIQRYAADLEQRVHDRTRELASANEQLLELDRLKSKFVSNVSHELRTPISNLKLYVTLLQRGKPERRSQYESMLRISVERLGQLVEDILNLSRLEIAQQKSRTLEPTDLNAVIRQVVALHQPQAETAGLSLLFEADANLPLISGDYNQLSQLVTNLIANALNYTPEGNVNVVTSVSATGDTVQLVVEDTGIGIMEEDLPYLFNRFYRGNHRQPDDIPGTGLGLAIVREIVDIHDGSIFVQSEVDKGTRIEVRFPARLVKEEFSASWRHS